MALFDTLREAFRQNPAELEKPHFYKASSETRHRLEFLREFWWTVSDAARPQIEQDIIMLLERIEGDKCIESVLANSELPIVVLTDLHLAAGEMTARIDFLVITAKFILIIESKELFGQIEVTREGKFIRTFAYENMTQRDEIRSPFDQIGEHLDVIRKLRSSSNRSELWKAVFERNFEQNYLSVAVVGNPASTIDMRCADVELKSRLIRCEQLADFIRDRLDNLKRDPMPEKYMYELAYFFMSMHQANSTAARSIGNPFM